MGNIGRSSTGCYLCRKRKIKCDEGKPGCRKCAQIRKPCPGYPFSVELNIRPDTSSSQLPQPSQPAIPIPVSVPTSIPARPAVLVHSLSDSRVPQQKSTESLSMDYLILAETDCDIQVESIESEAYHARSPSVKVEGPSMEGRLSIVLANRTPSPPPKYDVQHQSTCFFLNLFCWQASQIYDAPILDYLPEMLLQTENDSCLHQSLRAVSRMALADRYSGYDVRLQTGKDYVKALSATKGTIRDSTEAVKDETFLAVWMLGLYENINSVLSHGRFDKLYQTPEEEYQSHVSHIRGAMNLLRLRGKSQLDKGRGEKIFRIFKAAIQMRLFNLNSVLSNDFENLEQDVYQDEHEFIPSRSARQATHYFHTCARLLEKAKYALRKQAQLPDSKDIAAELQGILEQAEALDAGMVGWSKHEEEPHWDMMRIRCSTQDTMWAIYPSHAMYFFFSFWVYLYWLRYFVARVKLYEGMITVVQRQKEAAILATQSTSAAGATRKARTNHFDFKIQQYRTIVQLVAGQIIGLTAYALGDVTNHGTFYSAVSNQGPNAGFREVNVIAGLQLVIPLKVLRRSDSPTLTQRDAIDLALRHIGDGFRRQPVLI